MKRPEIEASIAALIAIEFIVASLIMWLPAALTLVDFHCEVALSIVQWLTIAVITSIALLVYADAGSRVVDVIRTMRDE